MSTSSKKKFILKTVSWRGLLKWVLIAFFVCAGLLNVFATAPLLAQYRRWGYPGWMHDATGLLELSSAFFQARRMTHTAGIALGGAVMAAAALTLVIQQEWLHALFPMLVFLALITSRITHQP
ncbi:DoxX family protein [Massilia sp. CCM 8734]|uniref:DoxX family protein n=1 Tax=Massilia sp. CCM 8734 TaxID=2609283 RepID=UPI00142379EA|nr:DoxX family protein [Massilia sp. CCM 8734]NHZ96377.1 DoxX family protein [Massilia sp. CCM 8734]